MIFSLILFTFAKKPVYLISGFVGSSLYATITDPNLHPQCPPNLNRFQFFPINRIFHQQYPQCLGSLLSTTYNSEKNQITPLPGIKIEADSIGNVSSIPSFSKLVGRLISEGYVVNKTLFGVPYDWIHYYPGTLELFSELKEHIENISNKLGEKVILIGHSMGTHVIRLLFSNFTNSKWIKKYVDRVILSAPAYYGCFDLVERILKGDLYVEKDENIAYSIRHMPSAFVLFENFNLFKDKIVFANSTEDKNSIIYPSDVHKYLHRIGLLDDLSLKIFSQIEPSLIEEPFEFPVPTLLFYNSELPTPISFNGVTHEKIEGKGDGSCQSDILDKLCSQWKHTKCVNWKKNDPKFGHVAMLGVRDELNKISEFIKTNDEL